MLSYYQLYPLIACMGTTWTYLLGNYEDKAFNTSLKMAAKALTWENWKKMGTQTFRKSAWSYSQSGTTACPSFAATCMRAEHSLGNVKDRYFVFAAVGGAQVQNKLVQCLVCQFQKMIH